MTLKFKNITPDIYSKIKHVMGKMGVIMGDDSGDFSTKGVKGTYDINAEEETLEIVINKTPIFLPKKMIASQIRESVEKMGGEVIA